jgi:hypothetical protein
MTSHPTRRRAILAAALVLGAVMLGRAALGVISLWHAG